MKDFSILLQQAEMLLSTEAFHSIVMIIEQDQQCVIDIGLRGDNGETGQLSSEQGKNSPVISLIPDWHSLGEI